MKLLLEIVTSERYTFQTIRKREKSRKSKKSEPTESSLFLIVSNLPSDPSSI
jgi:hypothetical protein